MARRRPEIPQYQQRTSAQGPLGPGPMEGGGDSLMAAGRQVNAIIASVEEKRERETESAALVSANEDLQASRSHWSEELVKRQQEAPAGAQGFTAQVLADFDADSKERVKRARTQHAREQLQARLADQRLSLQEDAQRFEAASGTADRVNRLETSVESARTAVNFRPADFDKVHAEVITAIAASGLAAEQRIEAAEKATEVLASAAVDGLIRQDPRGTLKELNNEKTKNSAIAGMGLDERERARSRAQSEINRLDAEARAARQDAQNSLGAERDDAFTARALGLPAALPDRRKYIAAFGNDGGKRYEQDARRWKIFDVAAEAAYQTPQEAAVTLGKLKPTEQAGSAESQQNFESAVKLYERQRAALEANPVQVLEARNPNLAALHNEASAAYVRASAAPNDEAAQEAASHALTMYFGALRAQQQVLGIAEPKLLSEAKRAELAQALVFNAEHPRQRTQVLQTMHAAYGDDYVDVMREVAPKLDGLGRVLIGMRLPDAQRLDSAYAQKDTLAKTVPDKVRGEIDENVRAELIDFASTLTDQPDFADRYAEHFEAARIYAQSLVAAGASPGDAANTAAAAVINDQYTYRDGLRVPAGFDDDQISLALSQEQGKLVKSGSFLISNIKFSTPEAAQADMRNLIARSGYWITNENGTGAVLRITHREGQGEVYLASGKRVEFMFKDLAVADIPYVEPSLY